MPLAVARDVGENGEAAVMQEILQGAAKSGREEAQAGVPGQRVPQSTVGRALAHVETLGGTAPGAVQAG